MGKIVVIGGGKLSRLETAPMEERILRLTGRKRPRAQVIIDQIEARDKLAPVSLS